jgi:flagellar basal-body rod modification protein FlgD
MAIGGVDAVQAGANQQSNKKTNDVLGKDQFMTLLVAQLQNQDPLNPMDSTGFTAQLAQFSSLEQLQNINSNLGDLGIAQSSLSHAQAVSFIGKAVISSGSELEVTNGSPVGIHFNLKDDAVAVKVGIYDSAGNFVAAIDKAQMAAGEQTVDWDGVNQSGSKVPDGKYRFEVLAVDTAKQAVGVDTYINGKVTGVNYKNGSVYLMANQIEIPLSSVISVAEPIDIED